MNRSTIRALLIEDDQADYQLVRRSLKNFPDAIHLIRAKTLQSGLAELQSQTCDVLLTDLSLPDSCGLETVKRIRLENQRIPIIVLTTLVDEDVEMQSLGVGAQDYLTKDDATPHTIYRAIHHAIQRQEIIVENQRLISKVLHQREMLLEQKKLLKKKNERLEKLYKTAHRFVDNVSHEFRTPLTVIKDYISLVREGLAGPVNEEQRRMLDIANVRTDDLNNMVDDMLDVSKLESGLLGIWRKPCRLENVIESVCPPLIRKSEVKEIEFQSDIPETSSTIFCDGEKVGRVIVNLVTNALKFSGTPGAVKLWAREDSNRQEMVVGVTDNGPGIDPAELSEIFKRFKQTKTQLKSSTKGFGLGLNIAEELVHLNLGTMSVESKLGQGATFSFTIPLHNPHAIVKRYLDRLQGDPSEIAVVALVQAQIASCTSEEDADDTDRFFNYLQRRDDLIFRLGTHNWLFVLPTHYSNLANFLDRVEHERQKFNRNRPGGPLPRIELNVEGTWNAMHNSAEMLSEFDRCLAEIDEQPEAIIPARLSNCPTA